MEGLTDIHLGCSPPVLTIPDQYNACLDFIDRNIHEGRSDNTAVIDRSGSYSYHQLSCLVNQFGNFLNSLNIDSGDRVALALLDTIDFPTTFWGSIKSGYIPIPLNTLLTTQDYLYILKDSEANVLIVSEELYEKFQPIIDDISTLKHVIISGSAISPNSTLKASIENQPETLAPHLTDKDSTAFWLYSSGSTGLPKGVLHKQQSLIQTAVLYGIGILSINKDDSVFSAAKLFFAYGLGNGMSFPFLVGANAILLADRPTPESVIHIMHEHQPSIFFGVPSLYAAILGNSKYLTEPISTKLRLCVSAGEALPKEIGELCEQWSGVPVLDGIGSTEMLHIFLSNTADDVNYGASGKPVPGYEAKLIDDQGNEINDEEMGELIIHGPSSASAYWNQDEKSRATFKDGWTFTGDKYMKENDYYFYCGRNDDMLKVSGQWVSPFEVESALLEHESVLEAAVVGDTDENDLVKPRAYVVLKTNYSQNETLPRELMDFVKSRIAKHKYPRWIDFVEQLPKTATGKIQRFKLRN